MGSIKNEIIGQSAVMRDVRRLVEIAAPSKTTVLVLGETGTGKELVARGIHSQSTRKGELISVNVSARGIPSLCSVKVELSSLLPD